MGFFFLYFCLMQRLRVGCDLCQSGPAHDFSSLVLFPMPFKTLGPNFYPPLQTFRGEKKERGKTIPEHWLIRSRKNDQSCTLTFLLLPFPNPSPLPWTLMPSRRGRVLHLNPRSVRSSMTIGRSE